MSVLVWASLSADGFFPRQNEIRTKIREFTRKPGFPRHVYLMEVSCHRSNLGLKELIDKVKEVVDRYVCVRMSLHGAQ